MKMNLWTWFEQYRAKNANDAQRLRLVDSYSEAYALRESQPGRAVAIFTEARDLAERLQEPWWRLLYEKFRLDALMHFQRDFREVLEVAMHLTAEMATTDFAGLPEPYAVADTLLVAYLGIDAVGYPETIRDTLTQWERSVPHEPCAARYLLLARRRQFAMEEERWEDAEDLAQRELDLASHDGDAERAMHFSLFAYEALCQLAHRRDADDVLIHSAQRAAELAQRCGHFCQEAEALAWLALARRRAGREHDAQAAHRQAIGRMQHLGIPPAPGYFTAVAAFHEQDGHLDAALEVRTRELTAVSDRNRRLHECRTHLERCRLLARLGRPLAEPVEQALTAVAQLRCPDRYVEELAEIQNGHRAA